MDNHKLPLDPGKWSGEILYQFENDIVPKHSVCHIDVEPHQRMQIYLCQINTLHLSFKYDLRITIDDFANNEIFTSWEYFDPYFKSIAGTLTFMENAFLANGVNSGGDCVFTFSLQEIDIKHYFASGIVHKAGYHKLNWHGHIHAFEPMKVANIKKRR